MRRAIVTLGHPDHAGMLRALKVLDDASARHGWEMRYVFAEPHPLVAATGIATDRVSYLRALRRWRRWTSRVALPLSVARLARLARGADVFYACTLSSFPYCHLAARLTGMPQVAHVYSSYVEPTPYRKHWLARAHNVVAPSADSLRLAERALGGFAPGTHAHVAYNGMDVPRIEREASVPVPALDVPPGALRVGMVGNLDARKNPALLVEAAALARAEVPELHVLLVGSFRDPEYERDVRARIAAHGLERHVTVTGFLPNPFPVVRTLDVLAHPARRDPFPLALLEGMALARPIVASAVGGIPEMLVDGESGLLFPSDDAPALARGLVRLARDPAARRRIGDAARTRLVTEFSLDAFAARMFGIFDEAVADGRR